MGSNGHEEAPSRAELKSMWDTAGEDVLREPLEKVCVASRNGASSSDGHQFR